MAPRRGHPAGVRRRTPAAVVGASVESHLVDVPGLPGPARGADVRTRPSTWPGRRSAPTSRRRGPASPSGCCGGSRSPRSRPACWLPCRPSGAPGCSGCSPSRSSPSLAAALRRRVRPDACSSSWPRWRRWPASRPRFGGDADPCHELVTVAPYSALRMLLLRTAGVLATSLPLTLLRGPGPPGARLAGRGLADPGRWPASRSRCCSRRCSGPPSRRRARCLLVRRRWSRPPGSATRSRSSSPPCSWSSTAVTLVAVAALVLRHPSFEHLGRQS